MMYRSVKIRKSAKGKPCTMRSPKCNGNSETVCWCHSNHHEHGKGMGLKAHDIFGFYGCSGCHQWYDEGSRREGVANTLRREAFTRAHDRSILIIVLEGILT